MLCLKGMPCEQAFDRGYDIEIHNINQIKCLIDSFSLEVRIKYKYEASKWSSFFV